MAANANILSNKFIEFKKIIIVQKKTLLLV